MSGRPHGDPGDADVCSACGEPLVRVYRRLADVAVLPLLVAIALAALVIAVVGVVRGSAAAAVGGLCVAALVMALPRLGVRWWGGTRCTACGHTVMLR